MPILVTLGMGYYAAYRRDFGVAQATVLTRLVMLYALPVELVVSILSTTRKQILTAGPVAALIVLAMLGGYAVVFSLTKGLMRRSRQEAAMIAMATTGPSVPFIGIPVLGQLFGPASTVPISVGSLTMNLIQLPLCLLLLQDRAALSDTKQRRHHRLSVNLRHAFHEPVVWAPMLALVLVCVGLSLPSSLRGSLTLLGQTTGGAALFASGIVLYTRQIRFTPLVGTMIAAKNFIIPATVLVLARLWHLPSIPLRESVLTMAIPSASINVILAIRFRVLEREVASVLFFGTLSAIITLSLFIWLTS